MRRRKGSLVVAFLAFVLLFPCYMFAQGGGTVPPTCCNNEDPPPPPPPPGPDSVAPGTSSIALMPQVSISDADLSAMGMTRSQFLDRLAAMLFADPNQTVDLVIPIFSQTTSADGTVTVQVTYLKIAKNQVAHEVIDTMDLIFITDGRTYMAVSFTPDATASTW